MPDVTSELVRVSAAGQEPLQLIPVKLWLSVDSDDDDVLIGMLMPAARRYCERFCRRSFLLGEQWQLSLDHFPLAFLRDEGFWSHGGDAYASPEIYQMRRPDKLAIELSMGPVSQINALTYTDPTNTVQTLAPTAYELVQDGDANPLVYPTLAASAAGASTFTAAWPATQNYPQSVQILYTTGAAPEPDVLIAMQQIVAHWYKNREAFSNSGGDVVPVPLAAEMLLWPSRLLEF